jgi:hypothetical protein
MNSTDSPSPLLAPRKSAEHTDFSAADDPVLHDGKHYLEWIANITVEVSLISAVSNFGT